MDGRAFINKELACAARVSPQTASAQTASAHLKQLEGLAQLSPNCHRRLHFDEVKDGLRLALIGKGPACLH